MVKKIRLEDKNFFECEECKLVYKEKDLAQKCENFCKKYNACNIEITKHAIQIQETK